MIDRDRESTFTGGLLGGGEAHEAFQRSLLQKFLSNFRSMPEMENFLYDVNHLNATRKKVDEMAAIVERMEDEQSKREFLKDSLTGLMKYTILAAGAVAAGIQLYKFLSAGG